ncbi:uncharacterized protein LOC134192561 isoform X2 [Corticium candelabrum]|uniref:uncharacterized protein LOC134192561 isoform X2 n=1 Tax=Corticium candelabrum TaxID=121492 RepID=UPI002E2643E7|nr:uncharacterized protein LOC134192561 isoform X2 [Corticium candelabrum]
MARIGVLVLALAIGLMCIQDSEGWRRRRSSNSGLTIQQNAVEEPDGVDSEKVEVDAKANEIDVKIGTVEMVKEKAEVPNIDVNCQATVTPHWYEV